MKKIILSALIATVSLATVNTAFAGDDHAEHQAQQAAKVSIAQAKTAAIKAVGGGVVTDAEFELERGRSLYQVDVLHNNTEYDVKIDANTGAIIQKKVDR